MALKAAIMTGGHTQKEIAELAEMHKNTLSGIVRGRVNPTASEQRAIAKALRVPISQIFPERLSAEVT
jgi:transcriptional regulator with XRE-family HTH domain